MKVNFAHIRIHGIDVAVFDARSVVDSDSARTRLLADLTARARLAGLMVRKSALAYSTGRQVIFFGTPDLVQYLRNAGVPAWTHSMDV
jgi:hypothetical protein